MFRFLAVFNKDLTVIAALFSSHEHRTANFSLTISTCMLSLVDASLEYEISCSFKKNYKETQPLNTTSNFKNKMTKNSFVLNRISHAHPRLHAPGTRKKCTSSHLLFLLLFISLCVYIYT